MVKPDVISVCDMKLAPPPNTLGMADTSYANPAISAKNTRVDVYDKFAIVNPVGTDGCVVNEVVVISDWLLAYIEIMDKSYTVLGVNPDNTVFVVLVVLNTKVLAPSVRAFTATRTVLNAPLLAVAFITVYCKPALTSLLTVTELNTGAVAVVINGMVANALTNPEAAYLDVPVTV